MSILSKIFPQKALTEAIAGVGQWTLAGGKKVYISPLTVRQTYYIAGKFAQMDGYNDLAGKKVSALGTICRSPENIKLVAEAAIAVLYKNPEEWLEDHDLKNVLKWYDLTNGEAVTILDIGCGFFFALDYLNIIQSGKTIETQINLETNK